MQRSWIRRACGANTITGNERDALEFAKRAAEHLREKQVRYVEAWSSGIVEGPAELENLVTFRVKPHPNGTDWLAEPNGHMHPAWFQKFRHALDYMLEYRSGGQVCAVEVLNRQRRIEMVILADRSGHDPCPFIAASV